MSAMSQPSVQNGSDSKKLTPKNVLLGLQHVLVSNVWLDPVFVAGAIGLPLALSSNMVNAIFIVSGLVTLIQATKLVRLPIVQGPSAAFDALMIAAGTAGSLAAAGTSIFVSSLIFVVLCLTRVIEKMRFLFAPMVSGVIIFLVGVSLSSFTLSEFLGGAPGDDGFADPKTLAVSVATCVLVVVLSQFGKGMVRALSYLIALVVGTSLSIVFGMADFSGVASKSWFGLPQIMPYGGFDFDAAVFVPFFIAYMVAIMEALGVYQAASEIQGVKLEDRQVRYGLSGEAAGSAISSLIGGFTTTAYPQNVALLKQVPHLRAGDHRRCGVCGTWFHTESRCDVVVDSLPCNRWHFPSGRGEPDQHGLQYAAQGRVGRPIPSSHRLVTAVGYRVAERIERS